MCSGGHGDRGSVVEAKVGKRLESVVNTTGPNMRMRGRAAENRRPRRERRYGRRRECKSGVREGEDVAGGRIGSEECDDGDDVDDDSDLEFAKVLAEGTE